MLWSIIIGFFVGAVAKMIMPGKDPGGVIITILLGIVGSMLAGWFGIQAGLYSEGDPVGFVASVIGAMILLLLYRMFIDKRHT